VTWHPQVPDRRNNKDQVNGLPGLCPSPVLARPHRTRPNRTSPSLAEPYLTAPCRKPTWAKQVCGSRTRIIATHLYYPCPTTPGPIPPDLAVPDLTSPHHAMPRRTLSSFEPNTAGGIEPPQSTKRRVSSPNHAWPIQARPRLAAPLRASPLYVKRLRARHQIDRTGAASRTSQPANLR
jgi:hypothetical protein